MPDDTTAPVTAEGLRERIEAAWNDSEDSCARCQHCDKQLNAVLAALAGDPGDLPARMAEALKDAPVTCLTSEDIKLLAEVALSVRWEAFIAQAAENAQLRARVEHAEAGAQVSADRLAEARTEVERLRAELAEAIERANWLRGHAEWLSSERDALKAAARAALETPNTNRTVRMLRAALDAPETPGDAKTEDRDG
jgi:chromosome segregation ATPase